MPAKRVLLSVKRAEHSRKSVTRRRFWWVVSMCKGLPCTFLQPTRYLFFLQYYQFHAPSFADLPNSNFNYFRCVCSFRTSLTTLEGFTAAIKHARPFINGENGSRSVTIHIYDSEMNFGRLSFMKNFVSARYSFSFISNNTRNTTDLNDCPQSPARLNYLKFHATSNDSWANMKIKFFPSISAT